MSKLTEHIDPPEAPRPAPMQRSGFAAEWRVLLELGRLSLALPRLMFLPRGSAPVLLIPGWKAPEIAMSPLRLYLRALGYEQASNLHKAREGGSLSSSTGTRKDGYEQ